LGLLFLESIAPGRGFREAQMKRGALGRLQRGRRDPCFYRRGILLQRGYSAWSRGRENLCLLSMLRVLTAAGRREREPIEQPKELKQGEEIEEALEHNSALDKFKSSGSV